MRLKVHDSGLGDYCAERMKILSNPRRMQILRSLLDHGPLPVGKLQSMVDLEQSLLSHHLKTLKEAGFVNCSRQGKFIHYATSDIFSVSDDCKTIDLGCCSIVLPEP